MAAAGADEILVSDLTRALPAHGARFRGSRRAHAQGARRRVAPRGLRRAPDEPSVALILAVDDDAEALERITDELQRYARRLPGRLRPVDRGGARAARAHARRRAKPVAIVLAARGTRRAASGEELLERVSRPASAREARAPHPVGRMGRRGDRARRSGDAMALGHIDYYVLKPWSSPDELFHRLVSEFLQEWRRANAPGRRELTVVADPWSQRGLRAPEPARAKRRSARVPRERLRRGAASSFASCGQRGCRRAGRRPSRRTRPRRSRRRGARASTATGMRTEIDDPGDLRRRRSSAPGRRGSRPPSTHPPRASTRSSSSATRSAARRGRARESGTTWASSAV